MSESESPSIETRLWALETLVALLFAAQHLQTPDPSAALLRLRSTLLDSDGAHMLGRDEGQRAAAAAELERAMQRIVRLQQSLPSRLVD